LEKKSLYFRIFRNKAKKVRVSESSALLNDDFCMNSHNVDSDEAMKRGDEALNALSLHRSVFYSALNASSSLLFKENCR
jgi:hypothetical protein